MIVGQCMKQKPHIFLHHAVARQPRPVDRALALLDVLLDRVALIVEPDDPVGVHRQIGYYKTGAGKQLPRMLLDLGDDPPGLLPGCHFILQGNSDALHAFWWKGNLPIFNGAQP